MILQLAALLALGVYDLAQQEPGIETTFAYGSRGTVWAGHVDDGFVVGIFTGRSRRGCTFSVLVDQSTGCVWNARGCGLERQTPLCVQQ